jgi:lipopolysaccharide biosynthesis regulator YciM
VDTWREAALRHPERASLVFDRLERAVFELGRFGEMTGFYRELLHRTPREASPPALLALAEFHRRRGDLDEAESFIQEALEVEPEHARAHRLLAKVALDRRDPEAGLARLDRVLRSLSEERGAGTCRSCGKPLAAPEWRCPHCRSLDPLGL